MRQELRKGKRDNRSLSDTPVSAAMATQAAWHRPGGGLLRSSSVLAVEGEESALQDPHLYRLSSWKTQSLSRPITLHLTDSTICKVLRDTEG